MTPQPINTVFALCDDFTDYTTAAKVPITQVQMITHAYVILKKMGLFSDDAIGDQRSTTASSQPTII